MLGKNVVDEELKRGFGLSIKEIEPLLRALAVASTSLRAPADQAIVNVAQMRVERSGALEPVAVDLTGD